MKQVEIKKMSVDELSVEYVNLKSAYADMKFKHSVSPIEKPLEIRKVRRTIARIATELQKRELE